MKNLFGNRLFKALAVGSSLILLSIYFGAAHAKHCSYYVYCSVPKSKIIDHCKSRKSAQSCAGMYATKDECVLKKRIGPDKHRRLIKKCEWRNGKCLQSKSAKKCYHN